MTLVSTASRDSLGSSFQHAVVRSINDKNAQLQNQLENLVREGSYCLHVKALNFRSVTLRSCSVDSEINLLSSKLSGDFFEKPLGSHFSDSSVTTSVLSLYRPRTRLGSGRRKNRDLQETSRERDEEYQKLKGLWTTYVCGSNEEFPSTLSQAQYDKLKRRALLAPTVGTNEPGIPPRRRTRSSPGHRRHRHEQSTCPSPPPFELMNSLIHAP